MLGNSYWSNPYAAGTPELQIGGGRSRRQYQQSLNAYDMEDAYRQADAASGLENEQYDYGQRMNRFYDWMGARNGYYSGLTTKGEGQLGRQHMMNVGGILGPLSQALAGSQISRTQAGTSYADTLQDLIRRALAGDVSQEAGLF